MRKAVEKLISRGLDGALNENERARLERLRAEDPEVRALEARWMEVGEEVRHVPAAPDASVAWQDIRRAIRSSAPEAEAGPVDAMSGRLRWASVFAGITLAVLMGWATWRLYSGDLPHRSFAEAPVNRVEWVVAEIPGATTMIYTDTETDMTVIWMDVAQGADPHDS